MNVEHLFCGNITRKLQYVVLAGLLTYPAHQRLPISSADSGILLASFVGITVAGLSRILTGFPINRVAANQNVVQNYNFFYKLQINLQVCTI